MLSLSKLLHVLAVGLWFGAGVFFTFVVGLSLFDTFEKETAKPGAERPYWLPVPAEAIVHNAGNPVGEAVVWYTKYNGKAYIRCFVPGGGV